MDKFILYRNERSRRETDGYTSVNLYPETFQTLKELRNETGKGIGKILDEMIKFCVERLEVKTIAPGHQRFKVKKRGGYRNEGLLYGLCGRDGYPSDRIGGRGGEELPAGFYARLGRAFWLYGIHHNGAGGR